MSSPAAKRDEVAAKAVASLKRFSMLPEVTLRIVEVVGDPSCTAADLNRIVSTDPVLCMRILKVVNSAFYGLPHPVASVERAIVLLGADAIRNIAMAASFGRVVRGVDGKSRLSAKTLWVHSLAVGAAAKRLAESAGLEDPGEAFLCGLLHDVGSLVQMQRDPRALAAVAAERDRGARSLVEIEDDAFGANHQDFGRKLCEKWQLPPSILDVIGGHEAPLGLGEDARPAACAVHVADALAAASGFEFLEKAGETVDPEVVALLGLGDADMSSIADSLPQMTDELRDALAG